MDKKEFLIKYQSIFDVISRSDKFLNWQTLANLSFTHLKKNTKHIKMQSYFPVKQGIGNLPQNSIFHNYILFQMELKSTLKPNVTKVLKQNYNNPKAQLQILRECGY
jgi:hypothetical protein